MRRLHRSFAALVAETQHAAGSPSFVQSSGTITFQPGTGSVVVVGTGGALEEVVLLVVVTVVVGAAVVGAAVVFCEYARPPRRSSRIAASPRYRIAVRVLIAA